MKFCGARGFSVGFFHRSEDFSVRAGDENVVARVLFLKHGADDFGDLLRRFTFGEDDFRKTLAQRPVMIHFGEAEVFEGEMLEALDCRARRDFSGLHGFQNSQKFRLIHEVWPLEILSLAPRIAPA